MAGVAIGETVSESRRKEAQTAGSNVESTLARLVVTGVMLIAILAAVAVVAVLARALAPDSGPLDGSPLAGFLAGAATAVASGAILLRRHQTRSGSDALSVSRLISETFASAGPALAVLFALVAVLNWWEPSQAFGGIAAGAATGGIIVSVLGALIATRIASLPLWLPVLAKPAFLQRLRASASAISLAGGLLVLASIPVLGATFDSVALGSSAVAQLWVAILLVAAGSGVVALRVGGDRALTVRLMTLRILASAATAGVGLSLGGNEGQLAVVALAVVGLAALLADVEAVRSFDQALRSSVELVSTEPTQAAASAKLALIALSLIFVVFGGPGDAPGNRELALVVLLATFVELLAVDLALRPLLVEQGPTLHRLARPWRAAWHGYTLFPGSAQHSTTETEEVHQIIEHLVRQEFRFLSGQPGTVESDMNDVFVDGVPAAEQASSYRARLTSSGLHIEGGEPEVQQVTDVEGRNPLRARVVVDYPSQRLVDESGKLYGRRVATRRWGMVWLVPSSSTSYRIADAVSQGSEPLTPVDLTAGDAFPMVKQRKLADDRGLKTEEPSG